jgi:hypothetical protein
MQQRIYIAMDIVAVDTPVLGGICLRKIIISPGALLLSASLRRTLQLPVILFSMCEEVYLINQS